MELFACSLTGIEVDDFKKTAVSTAQVDALVQRVLQ
jgi:hypothetical protein